MQTPPEIDFELALNPDKAKAPAPESPETLPVLAKFDTQPVASRVNALAQEINLLVAEGDSILIITDQKTADRATEIGSLCKKLTKELKRIKAHFGGPHTEYVNKCRNIFKVFLDPLDRVPRALGRKLSDFRTLQENERLRQVAEQEAEAKRLQEEELKKAQESAESGAAYTPEPITPAVVPEVPKTTRTVEGSSSQKKDWTFEIVDYDLVPIQYRPVDEKLIRKDVKGGVREIPGVRIYQDYITRFRT